MSYDALDLSVLKTITASKKHALEFASANDNTIFSDNVWNFSKALLGYVKLHKDVPTLRVMLERLPKKTSEKTIENFKEIWEAMEAHTYNEKEFTHDVSKLKKRFADKKIMELKERLNKADTSNLDIDATIKEAQSTIQVIKNLNQVKAYERRTLKDAVPLFREEYNEKLKNPDFNAGLKTGYSFLDECTGGLNPGELLLIGAESGGGKSMMLMNIAVQLWLQMNKSDQTGNFAPGNDIMYFSLEMPFKPCLNRVLSRLSGLPSKKIKKATLNNDEALRLKRTLSFISQYPSSFEIIDIPRGATMESIEQEYEEAKHFSNPKIVDIDYLGIMDYAGVGPIDDWLKLGKIAEQIHEFARVHNLIVLSAVQLTRAKGGKEAEDKVGMHRVGRSSLILQNANIAIQIETRQNEKNYPDMKYHIIKNREGPLGESSVLKDLSCGTLIDIPNVESEESFITQDDIADRMSSIEL